MASGRRVQVLLGPWLMLLICSLRVLEYCMKHCLYLFLCMTVIQCYGRRRRDLGLGLLGIRRMDRVPYTRIKELCRVTKGVGVRIDGVVLWWFGHVEWMKRGSC